MTLRCLPTLAAGAQDRASQVQSRFIATSSPRTVTSTDGTFGSARFPHELLPQFRPVEPRRPGTPGDNIKAVEVRLATARKWFQACLEAGKTASRNTA